MAFFLVLFLISKQERENKVFYKQLLESIRKYRKEKKAKKKVSKLVKEMVKISWEEYQRIKDLKELDIEACAFGCVNILNLGWEAWGKWFCGKCDEEHVLCPNLCLPASENILGCELVRKRTKRTEEPVKPNRPYDWANCYLCFKELKGAGKTGKIKNRNNPGFWGISSVYKVLCLECLGKKFYRRMKDWQRKKYREYVRRGYF